MAFTCPTSEALYVEEIKTMVFRQDDGITIPKSVREVAYELAVDVIIRSIARETYVNYEVTPYESFYGTATVILQDCVEEKIPLSFPRQRIYYGRVPEAFIQWDNRINFGRDIAYHGRTTQTIANLGAALGFTVTPEVGCCALPESNWRELPLREVYVNVPHGTQYEIDVAWRRPEGFVDECGVAHLGESNQVDGDKDVGLPENGIQPNVAEDPSNPFNGLPSPTSDFEQGGFSNSKTANLGDVDPSNEPQVPHSCSGGVCSPNPSGIYPSASACEAAIIRGGNWNVRFTFYNPSTGCSTSTLEAPYPLFTDPNDVFTYTDVVPTTFSCIGTGATQGNFRRNGVVFSSPSSLSDVEFFFTNVNSCP